MSSDRHKRLLWQNTLPFEMQPDIASGIGITMKDPLCIVSSWVIGDKIHILLAQTIKYILFWMANSLLMVSKSAIPPIMTWPSPNGTIECPVRGYGKSGPEMMKVHTYINRKTMSNYLLACSKKNNFPHLKCTNEYFWSIDILGDGNCPFWVMKVNWNNWIISSLYSTLLVRLLSLKVLRVEELKLSLVRKYKMPIYREKLSHKDNVSIMFTFFTL